VPTDTTTGRRFAPEGPLRILAIAAGGSLGTLARYGTERTLAVSDRSFPWPTFLVNVAGSFLLGLIVILVVERWPPTRFVRPFAAIGFCGGFTTFSTMVVEAAQRGQHGQIGLAAGYLAASTVGGVIAAVLGMAAARGSFVRRGQPIPDPDDVAMFATRSEDGTGTRGSGSGGGAAAGSGS
jgi:CrcB protein